MLNDKIYLLFSDGTWNSCTNKEEVNKTIKNHHFPFPMDKKGDFRRSVTIIKDYNTIIFKKGI